VRVDGRGRGNARTTCSRDDRRPSVARGGAAGFGRCPVAAVAVGVVPSRRVVADDGNAAPKTFRTVTRRVLGRMLLL